MRRALGIRNPTAAEAMQRPVLAGATIGQVQNVGRFYVSPVGHAAAELFAPDTMTPAQYQRPRALTELCPERRLLLAVLEDAFERVTKARRDGCSWLAEPERRWFLDNDMTWPCAFLVICEALSLAPEPIRRAVLGDGEGRRALEGAG